MLPRPFKDLEWHKGKKTRHRRHLSLLRQGPADHQRVAIFSVVPRTPFRKRRPVVCCALLPRRAAADELSDFLDHRFNYLARRRVG